MVKGSKFRTEEAKLLGAM